MKLQNKHFMIAKTPLYAAFFVFVSVLQNRVSACIKIAIPPPSSRVSPTAVPPLRKLEGTHGVRSAWGHTNAIDFVTIASSLHATSGRRAVGNTNRLKAVPPSFVRRFATTWRSRTVQPSSSALATVVALRLQFRFRIGTCRV